MLSIKRNMDLILDVETTTSNKGNPFDRTNKLIQIGFKTLHEPACVLDFRDGFNVEEIQKTIDDARRIIGFNLKFDLHWLRRLGINIEHISVWDCQLAEFILEKQTNPYNSLNDALTKYQFPLKLDTVKLEYWDKGIDTDAIPREILTDYLVGDLEATESVYLKQLDIFLHKE